MASGSFAAEPSKPEQLEASAGKKEVGTADLSDRLPFNSPSYCHLNEPSLAWLAKGPGGTVATRVAAAFSVRGPLCGTHCARNRWLDLAACLAAPNACQAFSGPC
jgi:hypothetical protein